MYIHVAMDVGLAALLIVATALLLLRGEVNLLLLLAWALMIWAWWRTWKKVYKPALRDKGSSVS